MKPGWRTTDRQIPLPSKYVNKIAWWSIPLCTAFTGSQWYTGVSWKWKCSRTLDGLECHCPRSSTEIIRQTVCSRRTPRPPLLRTLQTQGTSGCSKSGTRKHELWCLDGSLALCLKMPLRINLSSHRPVAWDGGMEVGASLELLWLLGL